MHAGKINKEVATKYVFIFIFWSDVMVGGWIASYVFIFIFWSRCCCCCCLLLLLPTTSVLKRREVLGTSIAAVVLGCFYFCPLDCDASVMVVDCAAVETGCMLAKEIKGMQQKTCSSLFFGLAASAFFHSRAFCFRVNRLHI